MALVGMRCSRTLEIVYSSAVLGVDFAYRAVTYRTPSSEARPCLTRNSGRPAAFDRARPDRSGPSPDYDDEDPPPWAGLPPIRPPRSSRPGAHAGDRACQPQAPAFMLRAPAASCGLRVPGPRRCCGPGMLAALSRGIPSWSRSARRVPRQPRWSVRSQLVLPIRTLPSIPRVSPVRPARTRTTRNRPGLCPKHSAMRRRPGAGPGSRAGGPWRRPPVSGAGGWSWPADWSWWPGP